MVKYSRDRAVAADKKVLVIQDLKAPEILEWFFHTALNDQAREGSGYVPLDLRPWKDVGFGEQRWNTSNQTVVLKLRSSTLSQDMGLDPGLSE